MAVDPVEPPPPTGFEVVRRGYDQAQVEAHLRRLDADIRILSTDRDAALDQAEQLNRELDDSRARADRLDVLGRATAPARFRLHQARTGRRLALGCDAAAAQRGLPLPLLDLRGVDGSSGAQRRRR